MRTHRYEMKVLLAEYTLSRDPALAPEGAAMLAILKGSFERSGHEVVLPGTGEFGAEIERLAPACDMGLVIAPDNLLSRYTQILEQNTHNLGCGFISAALCANKVRTAKILSSHGIPVPEDCTTGKCVVKPVTGCGAQGVRLTDSGPGEKELAQRFIDGGNFSVSIVANRVTGEACLYFTGNPALLLAVNRQTIEIGADGAFHYLGGETPVHPEREAEIVRSAVESVKVLGCQGYCGVDVVLADKAYVVDVNSRVTTSIVGIAACMQEEIADILIAASKGEAPDEVHLAGKARFDASGRVTKL